jgi:hypothetical protein
MENIKNKLANALAKALKNAPVSEMCPLIKNPKWNCRPKEKGNEPCCKSINGYTNCSHYIKWFYFLISKAVAREISGDSPKRKKEAKKEN